MTTPEPSTSASSRSAPSTSGSSRSAPTTCESASPDPTSFEEDATSSAPKSAGQCPTCGRDPSPIRLVLKRIGAVLSWPIIALVRFYQLVISPLTPPTCRYYPSCSAYALTAVRRYGPFKGTLLAVRRVGRCHPWAPGGVDYVPERPHTCSCAQPAGAHSASPAQSPTPQPAPPQPDPPRSPAADTTVKDRR